MRTFLRTLCGGLAVSALLLTASAQGPVKLVRLNVVAVDAQGKPVTDLTAADFTIVDDGKPQTIALFHSGGFGPAAATNPGEFTNRPSPPPHTTVVLFDCLNHMRAECVYAAKKLGTSLAQVQDAGSVYFYVLTPAADLDPIHALPASPGAAPDKTWNEDIETTLAKVTKSLKPRPSGMSDENVTKKTYVALETLGKQLANFPGRRDVVWVLGGVPWTYKENTKNPCTGIWVGCGLYAEHLSVNLDLSGTVVNLLTFTDLNPDKTQDMEAMAQLTGGTLTYGNKGGEISQVIQQLNAIASAGYVISYDPSAGNWDNKFHLVKINCSRKDVKLIAKTRYYALPDSREAAQKLLDPLRMAFASPGDLSDIGLRAAISPGKASGAIKIDLHVALPDLMLQETSGGYTGQLTVLFSARNATGPEGDPTIDPTAVHLTKEQHDAALKDGFLFTKEYTIDNSTKVVRLIVGDSATGLVGSLTIPVAPK